VCFDLLIEKNGEKRGIRILDWNSSIGIDILIKLDTDSEDSGFSNPILIADNFSGHVKSYSNRRKIEIINKYKILGCTGAIS